MGFLVKGGGSEAAQQDDPLCGIYYRPGIPSLALFTSALCGEEVCGVSSFDNNMYPKHFGAGRGCGVCLGIWGFIETPGGVPVTVEHHNRTRS